MNRILGPAFGAALLLGLTAGTQDRKVPAFPGAEGFGAQSRGGRGGRVIEVVNLNDGGPGSLRAAVEAEGPRIVVFRTGGTITLKSGLEITHPFITVAGQTAPGGGITLRNDPSNRGTPLTISTHDVVLRYLRSRPGPCTRPTVSVDALEIRGGHDIIIDHCSVSWGVDEVFSTWRGFGESGEIRDVTLQWSIISEGLRKSVHKKGPHSMGPLIGRKTTRLSLHHNLMVHNNERNPRLQAGLIDVVNNLVYNYGAYPAWVTVDPRDKPPRINFVGNYIKPGADSDRSRPGLVVPSKGDIRIYAAGNIGPYRADDSIDDWKIVGRWGGPSKVTDQFRNRARHDAPAVTTTSASEAYEQVLARAGCTVPMRDDVDRRVVDDVKNGTGKIIDHPSEVGGWPKLAAGTPPPDTDHDGMPDEWEKRHAFDAGDSSDGPKDADGDGYTNVEEFLNGTDPRER